MYIVILFALLTIHPDNLFRGNVTLCVSQLPKDRLLSTLGTRIVYIRDSHVKDSFDWLQLRYLMRIHY